MAEVFRAVAHGVEGFQRVFVMKRILHEKSQSKDFIDMFVAEARVSALLNHPNIVQSYDFGQIGGSYFISMEYLRGKDLLSVMRQLRATRKSMDGAVAAFIAQQVALGLHYAHSLTGTGGRPLNIVHRDVSPSNIMLLRAGGVKLLDFGIAKVGASARVDSEPNESDALIRGKLSYVSPEQIRGDPIDGRADVFSLGVCLWEMLTGRRLFFDKSEYNTMKNVMDRPVMPPSMQRPDLPTALDYIAVRALERDNSRRYRDAKQMADELEAYLADTHFAPGALPRMLDDVFGVDAGAFDAQIDESVPSSWGQLPKANPVEPNKSRTVPPVLADGSEAKKSRANASTGSRRKRFAALASVAAVAAGVAVFVQRPALTADPPKPTTASAPVAPVAPFAPVAPVAPTSVAPAPTVIAPASAPQPVLALLPSPDVDVPPPPSAAPTFVELRMETQPRGAQIINSDGVTIGVTPALVKLPLSRQATTLLLRRKGFADTLQEVVPDRDMSAIISLRRAGRLSVSARDALPAGLPAETGAASLPTAPAEPEAPIPEVIEPAEAGR